MSHELEHDEHGHWSFASSYNQDAWHRFGTVVPHGMGTVEALKLANCKDWNVRKEQALTTVRYPDGTERIVEIPGQFAILRDNPFTGEPEVLGGERTDTVGKVYTPMQNEAAADWLSAVTDLYSDMVVETIGSLRNGTQTFITIKLKGFLVGGVDAVQMYLVYVVNHITGANICFVTNIRVVCANTCDWAMAAAKYTFRHTAGIEERHEQVKAALALSFNYNAMFEAKAEEWIAEAFDLGQFREFAEQLWPQPAEDDSPLTKRRFEERIGVLSDLFLYAPTQEGIRRTKWGAFNAVTEYMDHHSFVRGKTEADREDARALRTIDGTPVKGKAFELLNA